MAKTIFILGAGASFPYGFPLGTQLVEEINMKLDYRKESKLSNLDHSIPLIQILLKRFPENEIKNFAHNLRFSDTSSIDAFLSINKKFIKIGKLCIAYILMEFEYNFGFDYKKGGDWYKFFGNLLVNEEPENYDFKIYTFNYERSLEIYLETKATFYFVDDELKQKRFMENIPIVHLHGSLGLDKPIDPSQITEISVLEKIAESIKIISEVEKDQNFTDLHNDIKNAKNVIFLGFGFHPLNMKRIGIQNMRLQPNQRPKFYASTVELEELEIVANLKSHIQLIKRRNRINTSIEHTLAYQNTESYMFLRKMINPRDYFKD